MTTSQIIACAIAAAAALVSIAALIATRRQAARRGIPYTPPPREHCGSLAPQFFDNGPRVECVLRPGHQGSHADEQGARWWLTPVAAQEGTVCGAYQVPATAEDSGLCAGCGMFDYQHKEESDA